MAIIIIIKKVTDDKLQCNINKLVHFSPPKIYRNFRRSIWTIAVENSTNNGLRQRDSIHKNVLILFVYLYCVLICQCNTNVEHIIASATNPPFRNKSTYSIITSFKPIPSLFRGTIFAVKNSALSKNVRSRRRIESQSVYRQKLVSNWNWKEYCSPPVRAPSQTAGLFEAGFRVSWEAQTQRAYVARNAATAAAIFNNR